MRDREAFQIVLRAAEQTETSQKNIEGWFRLDEGFRHRQKLLPIVLNVQCICFPCLSFSSAFCFTDPDYCLIRITLSQLMQINEG
jgi:hypothetical protein